MIGLTVRLGSTIRLPTRRKLIYAAIALGLVASAGELGLRLWQPQFITLAHRWYQAHVYRGSGFHQPRPSSSTHFRLRGPTGETAFDFVLCTDSRGVRAEEAADPAQELSTVGQTHTHTHK